MPRQLRTRRQRDGRTFASGKFNPAQDQMNRHRDSAARLRARYRIVTRLRAILAGIFGTAVVVIVVLDPSRTGPPTRVRSCSMRQ